MSTARQARAFRDLPYAIYPSAGRWVAPLGLHVRHLMARADCHWMALADGVPVARLGVKLQADVAHFGFFECHLGWAAAARALFQAARQRAQRPLRGPYHWGLEDPYAGILVDGFESDPSLMMPYNPPYYADYLEQAGLRGLMDLYSYEFARGEVRLDLAERRARRAREHGITVRSLDPRQRDRDLKWIMQVANQTHAQNWGYEPYEGELARELLLLGRFVLDPRAVLLAFHEERPVGFVIIVRDYNPALKPSRGWLTPALLGRLRRPLTRYRGYGMGVLEDRRNFDVAAALAQAVIEGAQEAAYRDWTCLEIAWVLATNERMNALAAGFGGRRTKTHRVYES